MSLLPLLASRPGNKSSKKYRTLLSGLSRVVRDLPMAERVVVSLSGMTL